jgi:hypothetical protein
MSTEKLTCTIEFYGKIIMNGEWARNSIIAVISWLKILPRNSSGEEEDNSRKFHSGYSSIQPRLEQFAFQMQVKDLAAIPFCPVIVL